MAAKRAATLLEYLSHSSLRLPKRQTVEKATREIIQILSASDQRKGATYSLVFGNQKGQPFFAVGLNNELTQMVKPDELEHALSRFLRMHRELLAHPRCCVGIWQAPDSEGIEKVWLDVSVLVYHAGIARAFAIEGNQIALYDLRENGMGEVSTGGTGESSWQRLSRLDQEDSVKGALE